MCLGQWLSTMYVIHVCSNCQQTMPAYNEVDNDTKFVFYLPLYDNRCFQIMCMVDTSNQHNNYVPSKQYVQTQSLLMNNTSTHYLFPMSSTVYQLLYTDNVHSLYTCTTTTLAQSPMIDLYISLLNIVPNISSTLTANYSIFSTNIKHNNANNKRASIP